MTDQTLLGADPGLIRTGFDARATTADVVAGLDLSGLRAIVTGGASGIGAETARSLVAAGAEVVLAVRNREAGARAAASIGASAEVRHLDLADPTSVRELVDGWLGPLHLLINNAGVMRLPEHRRTAGGSELQFATNHLGHFHLARGLHRALAAGAAARGAARVVAVSSRAHLDAPVDFDDLAFEHRPYEPALAYSQSKTANVLFAAEATRRWQDDGIVANALNPGGTPTNLQRHLPDDVLGRMADSPQKTIQQAAATTMVAAVAPEFAHVGGRYLEDATEARQVSDDAPPTSGVRGWALNPEFAQRLWLVSAELV